MAFNGNASDACLGERVDYPVGKKIEVLADVADAFGGRVTETMTFPGSWTTAHPPP